MLCESATWCLNECEIEETIDQLAMASSVRWYGHVLRREEGHVLILRLKVKGRKGGRREHGKNWLRKNV